MNLTELKVARVRRGLPARVLSEAIGRTIDSYIKRENGNVSITLSDARIITKVLDLSLKEFIEIFFDGTAPFVEERETVNDFSNCDYPLSEARKCRGVSEELAAKSLGVPTPMYKMREHGSCTVKLRECAVLSKLFNLSLREFNDIFFGGELPYRNSDLQTYNHILAVAGGKTNAETSDESCL